MIKKLTDLEYFAHPALNQSGFKYHLLSPAEYIWHKANDKKTAAMTMGSLTHARFLEPETVKDRFPVWEETKKLDSVKAGKARAKLEPWQELVTPEMWAKSIMMVSSIKDTPLPPAEFREVSGFTRYMGVDIKGKADWIDGHTVWDLKTTADLHKFEFTFRRYLLHMQAVWYLIVFHEVVDTHKTLVVSSTPPYDWRVFEYGAERLEEGLALIRDPEKGLPYFRKCLAEDSWPGCSKETTVL